ncbi:nucleotidyltransferase family protein [Phaeobacter sp.]|uniref:nucleotidyltransferase family protein n=1 Tax=Phaeobacter sp. TaxID=1902409 RepID=UPI0025E30499|nr:nucleotidyltransferase family protein [Phaeobacter sp.]
MPASAFSPARQDNQQPPTPAVAILLLAAGASRRMRGRDKLMEPVPTGQGDMPLIQARGQAALATGTQVYAMVPDTDHPRTRLLRQHCPAVELVLVPDAAEGMSASIRRGVAALKDAPAGVMVLPGDMPDLTTEDLNRVMQAFAHRPEQIHRATSADGTPGHPVIFPRRCIADLAAISGDHGARAVLRGETLVPVALPGHHALTDLDTPEAWSAWRAAQTDGE